MNEPHNAPQGAHRADQDGRSIVSLVRHFIHETTALLRDEVALAKGEVADNISSLRGGLVAVAGGAIVLIAGLVVLLDAAAIALRMALPPDLPWLAPLIVGGVVAIFGAVMLSQGNKQLSAGSLVPEETLEHHRRDRHVLQENLT